LTLRSVSVDARLLLINGLSLLAVGIVSVIAWSALDEQRQAMDSLALISKAARCHQDVDMLRATLRADVNGALAGFGVDGADLKASLQSLDDTAADMCRDLPRPLSRLNRSHGAIEARMGPGQSIGAMYPTSWPSVCTTSRRSYAVMRQCSSTRSVASGRRTNRGNVGLRQGVRQETVEPAVEMLLRETRRADRGKACRGCPARIHIADTGCLWGRPSVGVQPMRQRSGQGDQDQL